MFFPKKKINFIYLFSLFNYCKSICITLPTEIKTRYHSSECKKYGYPNTFTCPLDHPYLDLDLKQPVNLATRNNMYVQCESTKICCENAEPYTVPNNKHKMKTIIEDLKYSKEPDDIKFIEQINNILYPPSPPVENQHSESNPSSNSQQNTPTNPLYKLILISSIVLFMFNKIFI